MNDYDEIDRRLDLISQREATQIQTSPHRPGAEARARQSERNWEQVRRDARTAPLAYDSATGEVIIGATNYKPQQTVIDESKPALPILSMGGTVPFKEVEFLWEGLFSFQLGLIGGRQGQGKSTLACYLAANVSNPDISNWIDGTPCPCGSVLFYLPEGGQGLTDRRIATMGGKLENIGYFKGMGFGRRRPDGSVDVDVDPSITDIKALNSAINALEQKTGLPCRLVIVDPVTDAMGATKQNDNAEVSKVLKPLDYLAEERSICILLVKHLNKSRNENSALYDVGGSVAFTSKPRWVFMLDESPSAREAALAGEESTNEVILAPAKANDFKRKKSIHFSIDETGKMSVPEIGNCLAEELWQELRNINSKASATSKRGRPADDERNAEIERLLATGMTVRDVLATMEQNGKKVGRSTVYAVYDTLKKQYTEGYDFGDDDD